HLITAKMKVAVAQWDAVAVDQCGRVAEPLCRLGNDVSQHGKGIVGRGSKFSDGSLECAATREPGERQGGSWLVDVGRQQSCCSSRSSPQRAAPASTARSTSSP